MTYTERKAITKGFQANSICGDLRDMYGRDSEVSPMDEAKIQIAEYADANDMPFHVAVAICRLEGKRLIQEANL